MVLVLLVSENLLEIACNSMEFLLIWDVERDHKVYNEAQI